MVNYSLIHQSKTERTSLKDFNVVVAFQDTKIIFHKQMVSSSRNFRKDEQNLKRNVLTDPVAGLTGSTDHFRVGSHNSYNGNRVETSWK